MLSVIIPARNEQHLEQTIRGVLANARGEIEVLVILDAWTPDPPINIGDERVIFYYFKDPIGQRGGINYAAKQAKGKYVMKLDAHCAVDEGFDVKLAADCPYDWTVVPRMYNLDIATFTPKKHRRTDYMFVGLKDGHIRAQYYGSENYKLWHRRKEELGDTMCCMGPCFFMHKDRFWELGGCDEAHGGWGQQGVEVSCKAWLSGGKLVVNKKTWFSHWFRGGQTGPGFPYPLSGSAVDRARDYSDDLWQNNKWPLAKRKFEWLLARFNPPSWNHTPVLSVIIPSWKDPILHKTIDSILENFTGSFEIIPVIDGYKLERPIIEDPRVKPIYLEKNGGMRNAINTGVKAARGKFIMRADEHCMFAPGFDQAMISRIHHNWIMTARRYNLDPIQWKRMDELGFTDYERLIVKHIGGKYPKFSGVTWRSRTKERWKHLVDETMAMQGSCWVMMRAWWDEVIGELQTEGYGPHYQDSTEMVFKTWQAGGKLMVNKTTWFAHRWKRFNRTHYYPAVKAAPEWKYALDVWGDKYKEVCQQWGT